MHEAHGAGEPLVHQIAEEAAQLVRDEHALVDQRAAGGRGDVQVGPAGQLAHATDDVELALEAILVDLEARAGAHEELAHHRAALAGRGAHVGGVDGHVAPTQRTLSLHTGVELEQLLELAPARGVAGQEALQHPVPSGGRQLEVDGLAQERVGHLHENPGTVAGERVGARRAAMLEVLQRGEGLVDHVVARLVVQARHEGHPAGVVLVAGVVEASGLRAAKVEAHLSEGSDA